MNICIIGTGYVGLSTGLCLSEVGHNVICCDCNEDKIENLKKGIIPIYEPQMEELIHKNTALGRLNFTTNTSDAIKKSEVCFIAVGTPCKENGEADTSQVEKAVETIGKNIEKYIYKMLIGLFLHFLKLVMFCIFLKNIRKMHI